MTQELRSIITALSDSINFQNSFSNLLDGKLILQPNAVVLSTVSSNHAFLLRLKV